MLKGVPLEQAMCLIVVPQWALQASLQRRAQQQDLHCTAISSPAPAQSTMVLLMPALLSDVTPCRRCWCDAQNTMRPPNPSTI